jgi:PAS domain S-box-containing protein
MSALARPGRTDPAPALFRLLSDSALSRAALGACGLPLAILDAAATARTVTYANPAFERFFGYGPGEALGRALGTLVFQGDEALVQRLLAEPSGRCVAKATAKDGSPRPVELTVGAVRAADGRVTHWVAGFADRGELERLRAELLGLRNLAATP